MKKFAFYTTLLVSGVLLYVYFGHYSELRNKMTKDRIDRLQSPQLNLEEIRKSINADKKEKELEAIFDRKCRKEGFNGNVLISQKGIVLLRKSYGFATLGTKKKDSLTIDSKFQLASMSKTITGMAVMQLYERGKLKLTDSVHHFIPNFPYSGVTVSMLLSHRSGLPYYAYAFDNRVNKNTLPPDNKTILSWFAESKPQPYNKPNRSFSYNNTNYALLASIVERVSNQSFEDYVTENIFLPLGMNNTYFVTTQKEGLNENRTVGHEGNRRIVPDFFDGVVGDKGIYSTVDDLHKWYTGLTCNCLFEEETISEAWKPRSFEKKGKKNYGYGFRMLLSENNQEAPAYIYHNGWWKGYSTAFWINPKEEIAVIILGNRKNAAVYKVKEIFSVLEDHKNTEFFSEEVGRKKGEVFSAKGDFED